MSKISLSPSSSSIHFYGDDERSESIIEIVDLNELSKTLAQTIEMLKTALISNTELVVYADSADEIAMARNVYTKFASVLAFVGHMPVLKVGDFHVFVTDFYTHDSDFRISYKINELLGKKLYRYEFTLTNNGSMIVAHKYTPTA